jgi:subtilisin family serine protease
MAKYKSQIKQLQAARIQDYYIAETIEGCDIETLCQQLRREPFIVDASPDYYAVILSTFPNDMYFQYQYGLYNTGQVYLPETGLSGTEGSDIKATEGWDWTTGSDSVIIAVIDSGVAWDHEDLHSKIVPGYDFVNDDSDPYDDHGHGTFAASIAAAETNNGVGIAGVSWHARIMPIKVMNQDGYGSYLAISYGMRHSVDDGARVLNLSIGGRNPSFILEDASEYCYSQGAVIVAASGNTGAAVLYPAAYDDYCLAVAATDANDERPNWSNYGPQVDVAAPGYFVWGADYSPDEPDNLNSYHWKSGTSFAAPYAAGAAALVMAYKPFLTNAQIMALIKYTADDVNASDHPGIDDFLGYGRINLKTLLGPYEIE